MALSNEQRALIQLVLARGQSYSDIASLLGGDEDSVRERARGALRELAGADPDAEAPLTDYLLGQADPIDRADAVRALQRSPQARDTAEGLIAQLRVLAPDAQLPELPAAPSAPRQAAQRPAAAGPGRGPSAWQSMPQSRTRTLIALVAGAALAIAVTIVVVAGDGDDEGGGATTTSASELDRRVSSSFRNPIRLRPVESGPSDARGRVTVGRFGEGEVAIAIELTNLPRTDRYYVPWVTRRGPDLRLGDGKRATRRGAVTFVQPASQELLIGMTLFTSIDISVETRRDPPRHSGQSVLRGRIPGGGPIPGTAETPPTGTTPTTGG